MKRKFKAWSRLAGVLAMVVVLGAVRPGSAQEQPANEEYRVYEAVLKLMDTIPKPDPHVAIYDRTLTSKCAAEGDNPVFAKGCTFLWVSPDTDQDVEHMLRRRFRGLERSTWKNFKVNNASSITLHEPISAPWKHRFTESYTPADVSEEWASPDMTIYLSRVGLNGKKTEAIVYVLVFSYVGRMATTGDYLRFRTGPDKAWVLAGRVNYLTQDDNGFASLPGARLPASTAPQLLPVAEFR